MPADIKTMTDVELAREARAGSMIAFEELVCRYETRIWRFVRCRVADMATAEDIVQQVFVHAYRKIGKYDPRYAFAPWLFTLARRKIIAEYRARKPVLEQTAADYASPPDPSQIMSMHETEQGLWQWVREQISERKYTLMWLRVQEDLSMEDIARVMGLTISHTKVLLHRARKQLIRNWPEWDRSREDLGKSIPVADARKGVSNYVYTP